MDELTFDPLPNPTTLDEYQMWCQRMEYRAQVSRIRALLRKMEEDDIKHARDGLGHA